MVPLILIFTLDVFYQYIPYPSKDSRVTRGKCLHYFLLLYTLERKKKLF
jgi:hypothetical protein